MELSNTAVDPDTRDLNSIDNWFVHHTPKGNQQERYVSLREQARQFAVSIVALVPPGADRTVAIRKLRECVMTANAGIACDEKGDGLR